MIINEEFEIRPERDHFAVYINGEFYSSADTYPEAMDDIKEYLKEKGEMKNDL